MEQKVGEIDKERKKERKDKRVDVGEGEEGLEKEGRKFKDIDRR